MSTAPMPQPPTKNNLVWWILGIVAGLIVVVILGGLMVTAFIFKSVRVNQTAQKVEIQTPVGQMEVRKGGPHVTGLPVYPGARVSESGGANLQFAPAAGQRVGVAVEKYFTPDPLDKVAAWYSAQLGGDFRREQPPSDTHYMEGVNAGDADVAFVSERGDMVQVVALKKRFDGVKIGLIRTGPQEVQ